MKCWSFVALFIVLSPLLSPAANPATKITFHVADDSGNVVTGATVSMSTFLRWIPGEGFGRDEYDSVEGVTDTNGVVVLEMRSVKGSVSYAVVSTNDPHFDNPTQMNILGMDYYRTVGGGSYFTNAVKGKWQPWNPTVNLVIKKVINPIPMYARYFSSGDFSLPAYNVSLGYDLVKSDWLPPYGKGETPDFIFRLDCQLGEVSHDKVQYYDATLHLTFSNEGDGIQACESKPRQGSVLRLPRFAPESGYSPEWMQRAFNHKDESYYEHNENQNYFYRVRTKKDDKGRIVSALYGKIVGPLFVEVRTRGADLRMKYYLNPTPNDRNLEFDPKQNLLKNLPARGEVQEP
ncbi:MAG: Ig-like domain-containing protein [Kiritimatiellales bacterium]|jgi:hypothetical protein